jgi:hypothetical protein
MAGVQLPRICGCCGKEPATTTWKIQSKVERLSAATALTIFAGMAVTNVKTYTFPVSVCESCRQTLARDAVFKRRITIGGAVVAVAALVGIMIFKERAFDAFGILFLLSLGFIFIARMIFTHRLGRFDGRFFRFNTRRYHDEFAVLNPELVRPARK